MPAGWVSKLEQGWHWRQREPREPILPPCAVHEWSAWRECTGHLRANSSGYWITWQVARCLGCGRIGLREILLRRGSRMRVLSEVSVTDVGAVTASMQTHLRAAAEEGPLL